MADTSTVAVACAITHDTVTDRRFESWWTDRRSDNLSGCRGLYNVIAEIAVAIDTVPELEEVFIYDLASTVADYLLTLEEHQLTDDAAPAVAGALTVLLLRYANAAPMPFARYAAEVDRLCRKHLVCSWADLAGDTEPLVEAHKEGQAPLDFVKEFREDYDLEWRDA